MPFCCAELNRVIMDGTAVLARLVSIYIILMGKMEGLYRSLLLKALDAGRIRPFDRAAADLSPQSSCIWLQLRLMVEAAHWLINYALSLRDYFYYYI